MDAIKRRSVSSSGHFRASKYLIRSSGICFRILVMTLSVLRLLIVYCENPPPTPADGLTEYVDSPSRRTKLSAPETLAETLGFATTCPRETKDIGARWLARTAFSKINSLLDSAIAAS